jgi:hypothetical protein
VTAYTRSLSGAQPAVLPVTYADAAVLYADPEVTYTGRSPGYLHALEVTLRDVAGIQPTATGTLARLLAALRGLQGAQSTATGSLTRRLDAVRGLGGTQAAPSGTLTRVFNQPRALSGTQAAPSATLVGEIVELVLVSLSGTQPSLLPVTYADPTVIYADPEVSYSGGRSPGHLTRVADTTAPTLAGEQPTATGRLTRLLHPVITTRVLEYTLSSSQGLVEQDLGYSAGDRSVTIGLASDEAGATTTSTSSRELVTTVRD